MKTFPTLIAAAAALIAMQLTSCALPRQPGVSDPQTSRATRQRERPIGCVERSQHPNASDARPEPQTSGPMTAFTDVSLIAMTGAPVQHGMTVVVRGSRISDVGRNVRPPAGARVIDGSGMWMMPGLVDAHMHLTNIRSLDVPILQVALANGVTSELDMGGSGLPNPTERLRLRNDIADGRIVGPTVYIGAPKVDDPDLTRQGGAALVDAARADGYDFIKVYNQLSAEGYRGIMLRAHQIGMPVVGHVVRAIGLEGTLGSGQRGIVHMEEYLYTYFPFNTEEFATDPTGVLEPAAIHYLAEQTRKSGAWVTPTLVFYERMIEQSEDLGAVLAREQSRYIPDRYYSGNWVPERNHRARRFATPEGLRNLRAALDYQRQMTRAFAEAGVPLLVGTDSPVATVAPGFDVHEELANLVEAGVPPEQALAAATCAAAPYLGRNDFGSIALGQRADLLLLTGNPIDNIRNTRAIAGVMARGHWLDRPALAALLEEHRRPHTGAD